MKLSIKSESRIFESTWVVRHESCPIGFIAGVECDGAPYHSGLSVRDRDHIRQTVLENLGWNIYRVWSTDWFADPARETAKLLAWLERIRERLVQELGAREATVEVRKLKPRAPVLVASASDIQAKPEVANELVDAATVQQDEGVPAGPREPRGRQLRSIGDFETYEAIRGQLYEIWKGDDFLGEVEVISRATSAPRLYGDRAVIAQSQYEGRVERTSDCFLSFDLYAAMREVALRAMPRD